MEILAIGYIASWILTVYLFFKARTLKERNKTQQFTIENLVEIVNAHSDWKVSISKQGHMCYEPKTT